MAGDIYGLCHVCVHYSSLQMYASSVGVTLVIAPALRAKTNYASTEDGSHTSENRYKRGIYAQTILLSIMDHRISVFFALCVHRCRSGEVYSVNKLPTGGLLACHKY